MCRHSFLSRCFVGLPGRVAAVLVAFGGLVAALPATAQDRVVNVYNWSDYITQEALDRFTKETGIRVVYDVYDNNEVVEAKLLAGRSGYDVVFPSATPYFRQPCEGGPLPQARPL